MHTQHELQRTNSWENNGKATMKHHQGFSFFHIMQASEVFVFCATIDFTFYEALERDVMSLVVVQRSKKLFHGSTHLSYVAVPRCRFCNRCCRNRALAFDSICMLV